MSRDEEIAAFWRSFADVADRVRAKLTAGEVGSALDLVYEQLQGVSSGLGLDLSEDCGQGCEVTITSGGEAANIALVERVAAQAPALPGWRIQGLKPRRGLPLFVDSGSVQIEPAKLLFIEISVKEIVPPQHSLRVYVPRMSPGLYLDYVDAVFQALDDTLGERDSVELIGHVEVESLTKPGGADLRPFGTLVELVEDWRRGSA